jgi:hypothetical protein
MGWYDDEQTTSLPGWAVSPLAWLGCALVAVLPAGVLLAVWTMLLSDPPPAARVALYAVSLGVMIAAVKPWTIR